MLICRISYTGKILPALHTASASSPLFGRVCICVCVCVCVQLKAWEEYTSKLEEKYVALMTEHEAFQRELAAVRGILDDGTDAQIHGTHCLIT